MIWSVILYNRRDIEIGVEMLDRLQHYEHVLSVVRAWNMRSSALCGWTSC